MRVVIDTNIIVSGYLGGSLEAIIVAWKSGKFTLIVSAAIVSEYHAVLNLAQVQDRKRRKVIQFGATS